MPRKRAVIHGLSAYRSIRSVGLSREKRERKKKKKPPFYKCIITAAKAHLTSTLLRAFHAFSDSARSPSAEDRHADVNLGIAGEARWCYGTRRRVYIPRYYYILFFIDRRDRCRGGARSSGRDKRTAESLIAIR